MTPAEAEIRALVAAFVDAIRARDLDRVLAVFAPDVISFDLGPPLQHGHDAFRDRWRAMFATGAPDYEIRDLAIHVSGDVAFSSSLNRHGEHWLRWTACYRRREDGWLIVHEHVSVPIDLRTGRAVRDLLPT